MPHEYDDPVTPEAIEAAARLACELSQQQPDAALDRHVAEAVHRTFCGCAASIEDEIEGGVSGLHRAICNLVVSKVAAMRAGEEEERDDVVNEASADSFPASDPPAWIHRRPQG